MVKRFIICGNMTIEKTYKLYIKDISFELTEEEVSALYETCRKALNISITGTNPVKPFDNPIAPMYPTWPNTYPTWPVYPGTNPIWHTPYVTSTTTGTDNSVIDNNTFSTTYSNTNMSNQVKSFSTNIFNKPSSSTSIDFISDDMAIIKENDKWRSSVQQALDKLNVKFL